MKLDYCKIGLRYSFICQGTSTRRQRRYELSLVTTSLSTQIKVETIPLIALLKDTTSELTDLSFTLSFFYVEREPGKL